MYAYIKGEIAEITEDNVVIECNQIGYNINMPLRAIQSLPGGGKQVKIYTYTCVREDAFILYGFLTKDDLWMFKKLITVNGIGPKGALSILSAISADDLRFAIIAGDTRTISAAPGVGKKTAERVILDLKDKIDLRLESTQEMSAVGGQNESSSEERNEAMEAMIALGYSPAEAIKALNQLTIQENMDSGMILKQALKVVSRG